MLRNYEATGIDDIIIDADEDDVWYDLQGRPATELKKGRVYIKNGKKNNATIISP